VGRAWTWPRLKENNPGHSCGCCPEVHASALTLHEVEADFMLILFLHDWQSTPDSVKPT